ncbi:MAG: heme transporter CcmC [Thermoproteota archaeon]|nr:heme transporter CcmC [Thermoproteota archaeon]
MISHSALVLILLVPLAMLTLLLVVGSSAAFAQETTERYLSARIEIWALFYRLMVVAFVIGAVVMGTMTYVVWRFRESNPKNRQDITPAAGGGAHH